MSPPLLPMDIALRNQNDDTFVSISTYTHIHRDTGTILRTQELSGKLIRSQKSCPFETFLLQTCQDKAWSCSDMSDYVRTIFSCQTLHRHIYLGVDGMQPVTGFLVATSTII